MAGIDSNTKLISHFDGTNGATAYTAESGQVFTFNTGASLSTAQKVFGASSLLLNGSSGYVSVPDSADWVFGSGNFTIDTRVNFVASTAYSSLYSQYVNDSNCILFYYNPGTGLQLLIRSGGGFICNMYCSWTPTNGVWYHIAVVRNGTSLLFFVDGVQKTTIVSTAINGNSIPDYAAVAQIGRFQFTLTNYLSAYVDEYRISNVARWITGFTIPSEAYSVNSSNIKTINGLPIANIKSINGLTVSSMKSWNGLG